MRFLWWKNTSDKNEVVEYRHCRVVFGVSSSPFLLGATIKLLLEKHGHLYPETANILKRAFYVDNCCTSFQTLDQAHKFEKEARELLMLGQFDLRGWELGSAEDKEVNVLGLLWNRKEDTLGFDLSHLKSNSKMPATKRSVISFASVVFDPLGLICPFTIIAKMLFKRVCLDPRKFGWDTPLPDDMAKELENWKSQALKISDVKAKRFMAVNDSNRQKWSLETFCDASKDCYACCSYLRVEGSPVTVQLIQARARVTPSKGITIPRAELLACLLGARLTSSIKEEFGIPDIPVTYWSDSSTAITWITKVNGNWAAWVNNRVVEIRKLTGSFPWRHVPGDMNPADLPSRGCSIEKLIKINWLEGPTWLYNHPSTFPHSDPDVDEAIVNAEKRKMVVSAVVVKFTPTLIDNLVRLGDYSRVLRFLAFLIRYVRNKFINKTPRSQGAIAEPTAEEIEQAENLVIRHIQQSTWNGQPPSGLNCEVDGAGVLRVITRLVNGENEEAFQRPAVLPGNHLMVKLMIYKQHSLKSHAGVQYLQSIIREKYWIINNRRSIRNVVHACPICRVYNAKRCQVQQAPLPANRINSSKCFEVTGVDLAGPLFLKNGDKVWITIFTCAVYRAVHLELVSSLSTASFIMVLKKFVARRGRPSIMYSDNGTNFVGCSNIMKRVDWIQVKKVAAVQQIKWIFNPPTAAWWGGFWERLVGLMKQLLRRVLGKRTVDFAELDLLVTEVEAVMNDRPLTYISEDVDDLKALTPSMFMKDLPVSFLPELDVTSAELTKRLRYIQRLKEELRQRFRSEYLGQLISTDKTKRNDVLSPGDVVLVESDNKKRWEWPIGIIVEVYPGTPSSRSAKVKTSQGYLRRPFQRLFPLEVKQKEILTDEAVVPSKEPEEETVEEDEDNAVDLGDQVPDLPDAVVTKVGRKVIKPNWFKF